MNYLQTGTNKMRIMKLMGICLLTCFLQNCEDKIIRTYRLENGTEREIRMEFYAYGLFSHTGHIIGEGLIYEGETDNDNGRHLSAGGTLSADSIIVTFDNEKRQLYYGDILTSSPFTDRNILSEEPYEVLSNELYRFVFTEEDYENAADIEG